jgi:hypothetical protein
MKKNEKRLRESLLTLLEATKAAVKEIEAIDLGGSEDLGTEEEAGPERAGCTIKSLPPRLAAKAAAIAAQINPANAPLLGFLPEEAAAAISEPAFLTLLTSKYWGATPRRLTVSFMESTPADLRARILSHMNAWSRTSGITFAQTSGVGQVRISRGGGGYWSYLGTDILLIPRNRPTMNLQGFSMSTSEAEYKRVVRHETGHTLGFPHEHMRRELIARIDPAKAYDYFWRNLGWSRSTVDTQVLSPLDNSSIMGTPADQTSIMCYQLPGSITRDGRPITGGRDINASDYAFAGRVYPKQGAAVMAEQQEPGNEAGEWNETEDVQDDQLAAALQDLVTGPNDFEGQAAGTFPDPNGIKVDAV